MAKKKPQAVVDPIPSKSTPAELESARLQRVWEITADGFEHHVNGVLFGVEPSNTQAVLGAWLWQQKLALPPCDSIPIGSQEFRDREDLKPIRRKVLIELARLAGIAWTDALQYSLVDLIDAAKRKLVAEKQSEPEPKPYRPRSADAKAVVKQLEKGTYDNNKLQSRTGVDVVNVRQFKSKWLKANPHIAQNLATSQKT